MSKHIVQQITKEIWVSRDFDRYTHKIYVDGILRSAAVITEARARQIIEANPNGRARGLDRVNFEPGAKQFTWIATAK